MRKSNRKKEIVIVLENVRSAENVGSIFRTADAAGVSRIILTGYTPLPIDGFQKTNAKITKASLGAEKTIPWERQRYTSRALDHLRKHGFLIVAVEQSPGSVNYRSVRPHQKTAFIFGNEVRGLSKSSMAKSDIVAAIPMAGKKESLNISVAVGIAIFRILNL